MDDLEEVFRGNPQGPHEPVLDGARHPAEPNLVVLAFEDVNLGKGHFDLLSRRHSRRTAELLMAFRRPPLPAGFMKRTCSMYMHVIASARQRPGAILGGGDRSAEYAKPFWGRHPRKSMNDVGVIYAPWASALSAGTPSDTWRPVRPPPRRPRRR